MTATFANARKLTCACTIARGMPEPTNNCVHFTQEGNNEEANDQLARRKQSSPCTAVRKRDARHSSAINTQWRDCVFFNTSRVYLNGAPMGLLLPPIQAPFTKSPIRNRPPCFPSPVSSCRTPLPVRKRSLGSSELKQENPHIIQRSRGDSTTTGRINGAAYIKKNGLRARCPAWPRMETIGRNKSTV